MHHADHGFFENSQAHFRNTLYPIHEHDRNLDDPESMPIGGILHLDLESVAFPGTVRQTVSDS
jgi:hypothetical protein